MKESPLPPPRPWHREPWPWILMAGPFIALVGCLITAYLAVWRYADPPITEGATQAGLVVRRIPAPASSAPPGRRPAHAPAASDAAAR